MQHYLGKSEYHLRQKQQDYPVNYAPDKLINAHLLVCGMSGTGKSFQSSRLLGSAAQAGIEVDVFDVHDELESIPGAAACRYSQATGYGYNPLELETDLHTGGVNRQTEYLLGLTGGVNRQTEYLLGLVREASPQLIPAKSTAPVAMPNSLQPCKAGGSWRIC
jgi:DNA helicase HerA-like ATPase